MPRRIHCFGDGVKARDIVTARDGPPVVKVGQNGVVGQQVEERSMIRLLTRQDASDALRRSLHGGYPHSLTEECSPGSDVASSGSAQGR